MARMGLTGMVLLALLAIEPVRAEEPAGATPASLREMAACRGVVPVAERAACYDRAFDAFQSAQQRRDVVVVDRAEITKTRHSLFGFNLPKIALFSRNESKAEAEAADRLETTIKFASPAAGRWQLTLADGARWQQTDDEQLARAPLSGDAIMIRKAAMGSYFATISKQRAIRVRRVN